MLVMRLDEHGCQAATVTGGKAANLSRLTNSYPVPPGFCVTTAAYRQWVESGRRSALPEDVQVLLSAAYEDLARGNGSGPPRVAVRSSGTAEDGETASFAGQYATYLNVCGLASVQQAVVRCWESEDAARVQAYRRRHREGREEGAVAVLVQQLIVADVAFVAFSANPVSGEPGEVLINANWGLGESIVDGSTVPDTYVVRKADGTAITEAISEKQHMTVLGPDGVQQVNVPRAMKRRRTLSEAEVTVIADLVCQLEIEMGWPVDIEGAFQDEQIFLLQCRPITTS